MSRGAPATVVVVLLFGVAAGCAGGGRAARSVAPPPAPSAAPAPSVAPTPAPSAPSTTSPPPATRPLPRRVAGVRHGQLTVDGRARTYRLFVPSNLDPTQPAALVLVLHGAGDNADHMASVTQFDQQASAGRFVVAYPQGLEDTWNARFCCGSAPTRGVDDVSFLTGLLDRLDADLGVDGNRVFLAGFSNGAMMSLLFACQRAERVRAVASVAGAMMLDSCHPGRPVSVLEIHGTADALIPYQGGPIPGLPAKIPSSPAETQRWAALDGCGRAPRTTRAGSITTSDWQGCRDGTAVQLMTVNGGAHTWVGPNGATAPTTAAVWRFFSL